MSTASSIVGRNVRRLRIMRGLSAAELARRASLARATLNELEAGRGNPTLETLQVLAHELGAPLAALLTPVRPDHVVKLGAHQGPRKSNGIIDARLLHRFGSAGELLELWDATLRGGQIQPAPAHPDGVIEHIFVISGRLNAGPEAEVVTLQPGEMLTFPADQPHSYEATSVSAHVLLCMVYPAHRNAISADLEYGTAGLGFDGP